jgi:hypothetical protein
MEGNLQNLRKRKRRSASVQLVVEVARLLRHPHQVLRRHRVEVFLHYRT